MSIDINCAIGIYNRALKEKRKVKVVCSHNSHYIIYFSDLIEFKEASGVHTFYPTYPLNINCEKCYKDAEEIRRWRKK